jgi:hypothetical protein
VVARKRRPYGQRRRIAQRGKLTTRRRPRESALDGPRLLTAAGNSVTPERAEALLAEAESCARVSIDAAITTRRPDALHCLEATLAATLGALCAIEDRAHIPTPAESAGILICVDDRIELFARRARLFYARASKRLSTRLPHS